MDRTDEQILDIIKGNARISYQRIGDAIGMSRVAAKKRVEKLEREGIIRGYNTCIYRPNEITVLIDIITTTDGFDRVLRYVSTRTAYIRQIFTTTKENHIHIVAVSDSVRDLKYLVKMIANKCESDLEEIHSHAVQEIIKDVYGGVRYEERTASNSKGSD